MDVEDARERHRTLQHRLSEMVQRDPDQEVTGIAVPVLDAVINGSRAVLKPGDVVGAAVSDIISPEAVAEGVGDLIVRASDALLVVEQLLHSLPPEPPIDLTINRPLGKFDVDNWFDVDM